MSAKIEVKLWPMIRWHFEDGSYWADSPDVPGWTAAADTREELLRLIEESHEFHFRPLGFPRPQVMSS